MAVLDFTKYAKTINGELGTESDFEGALCSVETVERALKAMGITVRRDVLLQKNEIRGMPWQYSQGNAENVLPVLVRDFLKSEKALGVTQANVCDALLCVADKNRFNPIEEFLKCTTWDGEDRLEFLYGMLGVDQPQHKTYIRKWFLQCVALGLNSETLPEGAEGVLVLQGPQGCGKTSFFKIMCPFNRWFVEGASIDLGDKDSQLNALGGWICELGELDSTLKKEQSSLKAFLTRNFDSIRLPYARAATKTPRRTSFCATVNDSEFLLDTTGSRRFWVVPVHGIMKSVLFTLAEDDGRDWVFQLWAQVYWEYQKKPNDFRLNDDELKQLQTENQAFEVPLPYQTEIMSLLNLGLPDNRWEWWRSSDLAKLLPGTADARRVGKALVVVCRNLKSSTRLLHGNREYLVPLLHSDYGWSNNG